MAVLRDSGCAGVIMSTTMNCTRTQLDCHWPFSLSNLARRERLLVLYCFVDSTVCEPKPDVRSMLPFMCSTAHLHTPRRYFLQSPHAELPRPNLVGPGAGSLQARPYTSSKRTISSSPR